MIKFSSFSACLTPSTGSKCSSRFIKDILIDQFELKQTGRFRGVVNADDVVGILYHHWVLGDDYFPEERQRLQLAIMDVSCSSITASAGTVVESSCNFGRNEAVKYRDIELYALRDNEYPGGVKLGMLKVKFTERMASHQPVVERLQLPQLLVHLVDDDPTPDPSCC